VFVFMLVLTFVLFSLTKMLYNNDKVT